MKLTSKDRVLRTVSEKEWQQTILDLLAVSGYSLIFHDFDSRRNNAGLPDILAVRLDPPDLIFIELKTETGPLRPKQKEWVGALRQAGQSAYVWRPSDFESAVKRLRR